MRDNAPVVDILGPLGLMHLNICVKSACTNNTTCIN